MATTPPYAAVYRLVLNQFWVNTVTVANTLHLASRAGPVDPVALAADFIAEVFPTWRAAVGSGMFFRNLVVEEFVPDPTARVLANIGLSGTSGYPVGANAIHQPAPLALVITWRSAFPGRRGRGRTYLAGLWIRLSDGLRFHDVEAGIAEGIAARIRDHYNGLNNPLGLEQVVFSRALGGRQPPYSAAGAHQVVAHTIQRYYATMGSRRLGHGL